MQKENLFKYFKASHEIIRLAVMYYVRYPLSFRQVEGILHERGIDISPENNSMLKLARNRGLLSGNSHLLFGKK